MLVAVAALLIQIDHARVDRLPPSVSLSREVHDRRVPGAPAVWVGYSVPMIDHRPAWPCGLASSPDRVHLGAPRLLVLMHIEDGGIQRLRTFSDDCPPDGDALAIRWLTDVHPIESVAFLSTLVLGEPGLSRAALSAIGLHSGDEADAALVELIDPVHPEYVRAGAVAWLGRRGPSGFDRIEALARTDASRHVRQAAMNALARSRDPRAAQFFERLFR